MDDNFLHDMRADPPPDFEERLRATLRSQTAVDRIGNLARWPVLRIGAVAASGVFAVLLFLLPSVRASAQAFLDLFRVVNFTAVPIDETRIAQLNDRGIDIAQIIGDHVDVVTDPGPPQRFLSVEAAGAAAGFEVRQPAALPPGLALTGIDVVGARAVRITGNTATLQQVLDALGIGDLTAPTELDGETAEVEVPALVNLGYDYADQHVDFLQGMHPEVTLPAGVDLPRLGELGLRILGLETREAHNLAQAVDWRTTLIVPVPATATAFRQVEVRGHRALLVETAGTTGTRAVNVVLWSDGERVYGLNGQLRRDTLLQMANAVQ